MAQRQFRTDDTSTWADRFGTGSDGAYAPSTGTDAPIDSACTGTINTTSLSATNASFATGQLILIHQSRGTGAGQWELNKISSYVAGTITLAYSLVFGYVSGAQVLVMPQYSSGNIAGGVTLTGKAWNGTVGGIYAKFCNGTFTVTGTLTASGIGFVGGIGTNNSNIFGYTGEGTTGASVANSSSANGNGGAGGKAGAGGGNPGGGGNGTAGTGTSGTSGNAGLTLMTFGGGGGGYGMDNPTGETGQSGAGIVLIIAKTTTITGSISGLGTNALTNSAAGAGGSVLLKGQAITLGPSLVTATGGTGGRGTGGVGRIHADYSSTLTGTTNPTADTTLDPTLADTGGSFLGNFI